LELASRELGRNTPPDDPTKGQWRPARRKPHIPPKGTHRPGTRDCPTRPRSPNRAAPGSSSGSIVRTHQIVTRRKGLRNPHSVTRISAPPNLTLARKPPMPEATKPLRAPGTGTALPHSWPSSMSERYTRPAPNGARTRTPTSISYYHARADGQPPRKMKGHSLHLGYSVPDSVHCSRASVLPRPGLARDPVGVAPAAPIPHGPRAGQRLGLAERLVTHRRRRITCLVRGGRSCPLELHLHRIRPDQPASQETRI
jgi:hypothetical protein